MFIVFIEKNLYIIGLVKFKPMLFMYIKWYSNLKWKNWRLEETERNEIRVIEKFKALFQDSMTQTKLPKSY